jgi:hypothetical protein
MTPRLETPGFILELPDGRWITQGGRWTSEWIRRGLWDTEEAARAALDGMPDVLDEEVLTVNKSVDT